MESYRELSRAIKAEGEEVEGEEVEGEERPKAKKSKVKKSKARKFWPKAKICHEGFLNRVFRTGGSGILPRGYGN